MTYRLLLNCALKLVEEIILYYDARSKKHQNSIYTVYGEFPCIISQYYIKNQQDATLAVLVISNCEITLHVSDAFCVHHQDY